MVLSPLLPLGLVKIHAASGWWGAVPDGAGYEQAVWGSENLIGIVLALRVLCGGLTARRVQTQQKIRPTHRPGACGTFDSTFYQYFAGRAGFRAC